MNRVVRRLMITAMALAFPAAMPALGQEKLERNSQAIPGFDVKFDLVKLPAGRIQMGPRGDAEARTVEIKPVWMGVHEVTWDTYTIYYQSLDLTEEQKAQGVDAESRPSKPYGPPDRGFGTNGYAAISISRKGAEKYCQWLSARTGKKYRLPTEAEWEYACRSGGPELKLSREDLRKVAWTAGNADETPHPVGKKAPNAWGLHDMLGNVGEWVMGMDGQLVQKGGSWYDEDSEATCSYRAPYTAEWQMTDPQDPKSTWWYADGWHIGFRVVREE
jgi:formylglycine-generating enzyme required for sulfatase activity